MRVIEKADVASLQPLLCSIKAGMTVLGRSERFIFDAIATGKIKAVKSDRRTLLVVQSLHDYVEELQANSPAKGCPNPPRRHKPQNLRQTEADKPQQLPQMEAKTGPPRERRRLRQAESETTNA